MSYDYYAIYNANKLAEIVDESYKVLSEEYTEERFIAFYQNCATYYSAFTKLSNTSAIRAVTGFRVVMIDVIAAMTDFDYILDYENNRTLLLIFSIEMLSHVVKVYKW